MHISTIGTSFIGVAMESDDSLLSAGKEGRPQSTPCINPSHIRMFLEQTGPKEEWIRRFRFPALLPHHSYSPPLMSSALEKPTRNGLALKSVDVCVTSFLSKSFADKRVINMCFSSLLPNEEERSELFDKHSKGCRDEINVCKPSCDCY